MVEKQDRIWAVYPEYFNSKIPRRLGRRTKKELSVKDPKLEELYESALKLGLKPVKEPDIAFPSFWWRKNGRLLVRKEWSKSETIREIAKKLPNARQVIKARRQTEKDSGKKKQKKFRKTGKIKKSGKKWKRKSKRKLSG